MIATFIYLLLLCVIFQRGHEITVNADETSNSTILDSNNDTSISKLTEERNLLHFNDMILCLQPNLGTKDVLATYADYGCYCGKGGSGASLDETDYCCRVHDSCYGDSDHLKRNFKVVHAYNVLETPYTSRYAYKCEKEKVKCDVKRNNDFEQFVCECDRRAAECFKSKRSTFNAGRFGNVDTKACCSSSPPSSNNCKAWDGKGFQASPQATAVPPKISLAPNSGGNLRFVALLVIAALM